MAKRRKSRIPAEPVRFPPDLKVYLSAIAWNQGCNMPEAADLVVRDCIEKAFNGLPEPIRNRYLREIADAKTLESQRQPAA
jgi:hypothetical protein